MKKTPQDMQPAETFVVLLMLVVSIGVLIVSAGIAGFSSLSSPGTFPIFVSVVLIFACVMILRENARYKALPSYSRFEEIRMALKNLFSPTTVFFILLMAAYGYFLEVAGFLAATLIFLWIAMIFLKGTTPLHATWISVLSVTVVYVVFRHIFLVLLP